MFIEERHAAILAMLEENGSITTAEIKQKFNISYDSAKRDLRILEEKGELRRTHGGAIPIGEIAIGKPKAIHCVEPTDEICTVADRAPELISPGDTVYLPSGELGLYIAKNLHGVPNLTVATNSIAVADTLRRRGDVTVFILGGAADKNGTCTDTFAVEAVKRLRFDKAFITTDKLSPTFGLSVTNSAHIPFICAVLDSARTVVGLYTKQKMGGEAAFSVCSAARLDVLITDTCLDGEVIAEYKKRGVKRIICE